MKLTTRGLAEEIGLKPESIRTHYYRHGHYYGLIPARLPNGRLLWPEDSIQRLRTGGNAVEELHNKVRG